MIIHIVNVALRNKGDGQEMLNTEDDAISSKREADLEDYSLKMKTRLCQQYCCDCCLVPLGTEVRIAMNHMKALSHSSVSMYNTKVDPLTKVSVVYIARSSSFCLELSPQCDHENMRQNF